jgi:cytochrome P450
MNYEPTAAGGIAGLLNKAYEEFERVTNAGGKVQVLPLLRELRRQGPVVFGNGCRFGELQIPPVFKIDGMKSALVMDYDGVVQVLRSDDFRHAFYPMFGGETLIHLNGDKHRRYRLLLAPVFSPRAMARWETGIVPGVLDELLGRLGEQSRADLLPVYVRPYPAMVFRGLMDLPEGDADRVRALGVLQGTAGIDPSLDRYVQETADYLSRFVDERMGLSDAERAERIDAISLLASAHHGPDRLTREEIMATCQLLVVGGVDTTHHALGNVLFMMLTHPEVMEEVKADHRLIPALIEETMRLIPSAGIFEVRQAVRDVEVSGTLIPEGMPVVTCEMTANRDPTYWDAPDVFDIHRPLNQHLSFATGPHQCLGMHLARMQITCSLNALLDRFPGIRLDPDAPAAAIRGLLSEGPTALPVVLA